MEAASFRRRVKSWLPSTARTSLHPPKHSDGRESPASSSGGEGRKKRSKAHSLSSVQAHAVGMAGGSLADRSGAGSGSWNDDAEVERSGESVGSVLSSSDAADAVPESDADVEEERRKLLEKMDQVKERLRAENAAREADVDEYIRITQKMPITPENPQLIRIKQIFEKKNKKHSNTADSLQKKLESYQWRLRELESGERPTKLMSNVSAGLKEMGGAIKGTLTGGLGRLGASTAAAPKELATRLRHKAFGSADNLPNAAETLHMGLEGLGGAAPSVAAAKSGGGDSNSMPRSGRKAITAAASQSTFYTDVAGQHDTRALSADQVSIGGDSGPHLNSAHHNNPLSLGLLSNSGYPSLGGVTTLDSILREIRGVQERQDKFQAQLEHLQGQMQSDTTSFQQAYHEEKYRVQRLEDQLNDTIELHQAETQNLKAEMSSMTARLEYFNQEQYRDVQEELEKLQTRALRLEREGAPGPDVDGVGVSEGANLLLLKAINLLVLLLQLLLVLVSTIANSAQPFFRSRSRSLLTVGCVLGLVVLYQAAVFSEEASEGVFAAASRRLGSVFRRRKAEL